MNRLEPGEVELDDDLIKALKTVVDTLERDDKEARDEKLREWEQADYYWRGIQHLFWSDVVHDWMTPTDEEITEEDLDPVAARRVINMYRAHGESIVSALSSGIPTLRFFPSDADNPDDIGTAKAYTKLGEIIGSQNDAPLLFIKALYLMYNHGVVYAYNCYHASDKYGTVEIPVFDKKEVQFNESFCPTCNENLTEAPPVSLPAPTGDVLAGGAPPEAGGDVPQGVLCPNCGPTEPAVTSSTEEVPYIKERKPFPKGRELVAILGPLNVKTSPWASSPDSWPYVILEDEQHYALMREVYPRLGEKISENSSQSERFDRPARGTEEARGVVTRKSAWLRPWAFNVLGESERATIDALRKLFPNGPVVTFVDDEFAEARDEALDEHWTVTINPLSDKIHADPIGRPLVPVQEMKNEMLHLTLQTIEYGVPELFADQRVVDFAAYKKLPGRPGTIYPAKPRPGQTLEQSFFMSRSAILPKEASELDHTLDQAGQFVVGDFPSVYGGSLQGGSGTYGEYRLSRDQALQRLSIPWKVLNNWWPAIFKKAIDEFKDNMLTDEQHVQSQGDGYTNLIVRRSELRTGSIGRVEPESSEQFPTTWAQKRGVLMELLQYRNPAFEAFIFHPENAELLAQMLGLEDLYIPGDQDRNKQLREIAIMLQGQPSPDPMNPGVLIPSIPVDPEVDNHQVEATVCRDFLVSPAGQDAKENNPAGYQNVLAHFRGHNLYVQQAMMMPQAPVQGPTNGTGNNPSPAVKKAQGEAVESPPRVGEEPGVM